MSFKPLARRVLHGYARFLRAVGETVSIIAGLAAFAVIIAYPIWWLAVKHRGVYTVLILGGGAATVVFFVVRRLISGSGRRGERRHPALVRRFLVGCLFAVGAYGTAILISRSLLVGIAAAVILLALFGLWAFGCDRSTDRR
jgi:hypothetical protein